MIIINQNKTMIVNFNTVENIQIRALPINEHGYAISIETFACNFERFAIYETEERANEVLQEIIKAYLNCNEQNVLAEYAYVKNIVFEMPKE